ncbi:hypothetical protein OAF34_03325 [Pirellulaceae bacterium]|nr:hypothetical protein [Pirellulaceae bacterium]
MKSGKNMWAIRAGKNGCADRLFFESKVIALEDDLLGDLSDIEPNRVAFKLAYREKHLEASPGGSANIAGKFFRFCNEVKTSHVVIYYRLADQHFYAAIVAGNYTFKPQADYPHQHLVKWKARFPKSAISVTAQRELGAARTFFQVSRHIDEINRVLEAAESFSMEMVKE